MPNMRDTVAQLQNTYRLNTDRYQLSLINLTMFEKEISVKSTEWLKRKEIPTNDTEF